MMAIERRGIRTKYVNVRRSKAKTETPTERTSQAQDDNAAENSKMRQQVSNKGRKISREYDKRVDLYGKH